jgi:hypothetical protein
VVQPIATIMGSGTPYGWNVALRAGWRIGGPFAIVLAGMLFGAAALRWRIFVQWMGGLRGRDWVTISAVVDVVSVLPQRTRDGVVIGYLATLTYFYRNPELQVGEYSRVFGRDDKAGAEAWASSCKGRTVMVHVDPRDPARSVLRKEEVLTG